MTSIGRLNEFDPNEEDVGAYLLRLKHFFKANSIADRNRVSVLITVIGPKVLAILSDLVAPDEVDSKSYDELADILKSHFSPKKLIVAERYVFYSRCQRPGESIADFSVAIKHLASSCSFGGFLKDALRDKLICGIQNESIRQKLLSEEKCWEDTYSMAIRLEQAEKKSSIFVNQGEIAKIHVQNNGGSEYKYDKLTKSNNVSRNSFSSHDFRNHCWRCGSTDHNSSDCSYINFKCHSCKKMGHLFKMCRARGNKGFRNGNNNLSNKSKLNVHQLEDEEKEKEEEIGIYNFDPEQDRSKSTSQSTNSSYKVNIKINDVPVTMDLDTGSAVSICPTEHFEELFGKVALKKINLRLVTYSGNEVPVDGEAQVKVVYKQQCLSLPLIVVNVKKRNQPMLLGRNWLSKLKLDWSSIFGCGSGSAVFGPDKVKGSISNISGSSSVNGDNNDIVSLKNKYSPVFRPGIGEVKRIKAHIKLKEGVTPKFCKFRPVPFALRTKVEEELDRWEQQGIAYKVTNSEWSSPLVVVPKPNGVRLCIDFKVTLNQCIEIEHYPLPQIDDIFTSLSGCSVFSCLDLTNAYLQLPVAEESQPLLTVTTHKGLYRLRRLPFGLSSSPAIFQSAIDQIIGGIPGCCAYLDDLIVAGCSRQQALDRLETVLKRLLEYGVRVNESKCKFLQPSISYLGYILSGEGLKPQESKLSALKGAPEPSNKDELRAYLGLINYYGKFIPNLSSRLSCFYDLLHKDAHWKWTKECSQTFQESKNWVLNSSLLVHYDVNKPIVLTCDASPRGVAAVLSHLIDGQERPIAFASKSLSPSERNYSQLHREALALVFGVKKFHKYIYGRKNCILQTDHQPLATIFGSKKGVPTLAAARLQRWALAISMYSFEIKYRKAADVAHADALSRLPLPDCESVELECNYFSHVESCVEAMNFYCAANDRPSITASDVARLTDRDPILSKVKDYVMCGWRFSDKDPDLEVFLRKKDELSVDQHCVLWGSRVVIPQKLQHSVLQMLHDQHPGVTRMKLLARCYVWWPGIDQAIEKVVSTCQICQFTRNADPRIPLRQWPMATYRWQRVHIDFAEDPHSRQHLLVIVDSYSKWLEVFIMSSLSSMKAIERLRTLFSSYGFPEELVSDNGGTFTSYEFREFLKKNSVKFTLTPPYHPESNGAAERCVQEVKKNLVRQVLEAELGKSYSNLQHKLDNFLFAYRNTPTSVTGMTPAEMFLNWKPRTRLTLLKPAFHDVMLEKKMKQKEASDRCRGPNKLFVEGQKVFVKTVRQEKVSWVMGRIICKKSPVTYLVRVMGKVRFCHADHLRTCGLDGEQEENVDFQRKTQDLSNKHGRDNQQEEEFQFENGNHDYSLPLDSSSQTDISVEEVSLPRRSGRVITKSRRLNL